MALGYWRLQSGQLGLGPLRRKHASGLRQDTERFASLVVQERILLWGLQGASQGRVPHVSVAPQAPLFGFGMESRLPGFGDLGG